MKRAKLHKTDMTKEQIAALPSATRHRLNVRGYCWRNYHVREENVDANKFTELLDVIEYQVKLRIRWAYVNRLPFPFYMSYEDVRQEIYLRLLEKSGKDEFRIRNWRWSFITNTIKKLSRTTDYGFRDKKFMSRFERDN